MRWTSALVVAALCVVSLPADADSTGEQALRARADDLFEKGQYEDAARAAELAVDEDEKQLGPDHAETAAALHRLAEAYAAMAQYGKAVPIAARALGIRERTLGPENPATAESLNDLGVLYLKSGDIRAARELIERALRVRQQLADRAGPADQDAAVKAVAESLTNLAVADQREAAADRRKAEEYRGEKKSEAAQQELEAAQRKLEAALQHLEAALQKKEAVYPPGHPLIGTAHNNLAAVYLEMAQSTSNEAERQQYSQAASEHAVKAKFRSAHAETATALINRAWSLWEAGPLTTGQVRDLFEQAVAVREKTLGPQHPDTAQALVLLAAFHESTGDFHSALTLFQRALPAEDAVLAHTIAVGDETQKLAFVEQAQGHYLAALSLIQQQFPADPDAVRFGLESVLRRKGIVLDVESRTQEGIAKHLDGATLNAWRRLTQERNELTTLLLRGPNGKSADEYKGAIQTLQQSIQRAESALAARSALIADEVAQRRATVPLVTQHLPQDSALVEFVRIRDWDRQRLTWSATSRYLAFVLTADGQVTLVDLGDASVIDAKIASTLSAINDSHAFDDPHAYGAKTDGVLRELHQLLMQPLAAAIGARPRLIVSPDGEINKVPFEALRTPANRYLVEERTLSHVTSGRDLLRTKTGIAPTMTLLLVANPAFDDKSAAAEGGRRRETRPGGLRRNFGALPGTAQEAEAIQPLVTGTKRVLLGPAATEAAVRETKSPQVLHLATHGFFIPDQNETPVDPLGRPGRGLVRGEATDPLRRSGIALAGANNAYIDTCDEGILCAKEVEDMDLYGTDLVVLSACETALGEIKIGEGVYGLRRAFVLAGARNLVMSLWPVDDEVTRDLMERFYRDYRAGDSPVDALRKAQIETIISLRTSSKESKGVAMANLWAPFIVQQTGE